MAPTTYLHGSTIPPTPSPLQAPETPAARRRILLASLLITTAALALTAACGEPAPEAPAERRVENEALNLVFADLPESLQLSSNTDERVELEPRPPSADESLSTAEQARRLWVEVTPVSEFGIDLVAKVNLQKDLFEALPEGAYSGAREIMVPAAGGKAYYVRGQYTDSASGGTRVEEVRVLLVHPSENRLVTFTTRYPEGGSEVSKVRIQELFDWVGEMSALRGWDEVDGEQRAATGENP